MTKLNEITDLVLLQLYDSQAKYNGGDWAFESAFRAKKIDDYSRWRQPVFDRMIAKGWLVASDDFQMKLRSAGKHKAEIWSDADVRLTPRGVNAAIEKLALQEPKSVIEKLHSARWATWGGIAAIIAAIASTIAALK